MSTDEDETGERGRGILSPADRRYLRNPDDYSDPASYNREEKIRDRLDETMKDFTTLAAYADDEILQEVFAPEQIEENDDHSLKERDAARAIVQAVSFLIRAANIASPGPAQEADVDPFLGTGAVFSEFERLAAGGVGDYLNRQHKVTAESVSVNVNVRDLKPIEEYREELADKAGPITGRDRIEAAARLGRAGYSTDEIIEAIGETPNTDEE